MSESSFKVWPGKILSDRSVLTPLAAARRSGAGNSLQPSGAGQPAGRQPRTVGRTPVPLHFSKARMGTTEALLWVEKLRAIYNRNAAATSQLMFQWKQYFILFFTSKLFKFFSKAHHCRICFPIVKMCDLNTSLVAHQGSMFYVLTLKPSNGQLFFFFLKSRKVLHELLTVIVYLKPQHQGTTACIPLQETPWKGSVYKASLFLQSVLISLT